MSGVPPQLSLSFLLSAARNHWFAGLMAMSLPIGLAVLAMMFLPRKYVSEAMIFVKLGRETVSLDPTASTGNRVSVLESRDNEINSIRDMLYSRGIMEKIVDRVGPGVVLGEAELTDESFEGNFVEGTDFRDSPRQKAIKELVENIDVINSRQSSVLKLSVKAASPVLAQRILKEYLDVYLEMHTNAHQTPQSNRFFDEQAKLLKVQWQEAMKALQIAKEDAGVVSIEGARDNLKAQTNETEMALMSVDSRLLSTQARLEKFESIIAQNPLDQQRIRGDYLAAKSDLSGMLAEKKTHEAQLRSMLEKAAKLNRDEVIIAGLEQEVQIAATNFAQYEELHEQTRIEEALHSNRFTNVRIVQDPSFVPKPVSPKKTLIGIAGIVAGGSGAVLIALLLEFLTLNRSEPETPIVSESDYPDDDEFTAEDTEIDFRGESSDREAVAREVVDAANG